MDISSKKSKIIIIVVIAVLVATVFVVFKIQRDSRQKEELIKDDVSDPAVSQDDIENEEFNPALDVVIPDKDDNSEEIIEDPEAEGL
jgi:hypothetical protein